MKSRFGPALLPAALLAACTGESGPEGGSAAGAAARGLVVAEPLVDLGRFYAGEQRDLHYAFEVVDEAVTLERLRPLCGCLESRIEVDGRAFAGGVLPAGSRGEVFVRFDSSGFDGRKDTGVVLEGRGTGLPIELGATSFLEPWFALDPPRLALGELDAAAPTEAEVVVSGPEPFRLLAAGALPAGVTLAGAPSAAAATEHRVRVTIDPTGIDGRETHFLRLEADNGFGLILPIQYEVVPDLWVRPDRLVALGRLEPGVPAHATVEVGVESGRLAPPDCTLEGIPGATLDTVTLKAETRYRIRMRLPGDLPDGPFGGLLRLRMHHDRGAGEELVERELRVVGLIQGAEAGPSR